MKPLIRTLLLAGVCMGLGAGESDPAPFYVQVRVDQPLLALKDQVGNRVGTGGSMGYAFYQHWALTNAATEDARTRLAGAMGLGYRYEKGFSLEVRYHGVQVDEHTRIGSLALGFGARF